MTQIEQPNSEPEEIHLKDLEKEFSRLSFLVNTRNVHIKKEMEISIKAGDIVGVLYDKLLAQYKLAKNIDMDRCLKSLNMLCVRLVFCLYAEDAGIFGYKSMFGDFINRFSAQELRNAHQENDRAVMAAYGFSTKMTESECVAELFKMYQNLVKE